MQIDKQQIISMLRDRGDDQKAQEAERELPGQVDPQRDSGLLQRFGIDPQELASKFLGGKGIPGL